MKKAVRWLIIALVAIWVFEDPSGAAALAHHALAMFTHAAQSLSTLAHGIG